MSAPTRVHVIVVGAGPAGATLALLLAQRDVEVLLVERQADFVREFRGEVILPGGSAVLAQLGLESELARVPQRAPDHIELRFDGRLVLDEDIDFAALGIDPVPKAISQPALLETLVAAGEELPSFHFLRGTSVTEVRQDGGRVTGITASRGGVAQRYDADLVVGADGRASAVRKALGFENRSDDLPMDVVWFKVPPLPSDEGRSPTRVFAGNGHLMIAYVTHDGSLQVAWVIVKGTFGEIKTRGIAEWIDEMANYAGGVLGDHLRAHRDASIHPFLLATRADHVTRWWVPGALLIGDAAHTMSPVGGQGINIALRDTVSVVNHLLPVLRAGASPEAVDEACAAVEAERAPDVRAVQQFQAFPPKVLFRRALWARLVRRAIPFLLRRQSLRWRAFERIGPLLLEGEPVVIAESLRDTQACEGARPTESGRSAG